jgi:hypothetical protein
LFITGRNIPIATVWSSGTPVLLHIMSCRWKEAQLLPGFLTAADEWQRRRGQLKCDGTRAETIFCLSAKRTSPFKSAGASVQSTAGSRGVRINGSNAGYTMFRGRVKSTGYLLHHSPVSPSLPLSCLTVWSLLLLLLLLLLPPPPPPLPPPPPSPLPVLQL